MKRSAMWIAAVLVLVATPAVLGLVVLRDDDGAGDRRQAALGPVDPSSATDTLVIPPITSTTVGIIVESYSWGLNVPYAFSTTGGATTGRATFQPLTITKGMDATSAGLFLQAAKGMPVPSAILRLNGGNGGMYELNQRLHQRGLACWRQGAAEPELRQDQVHRPDRRKGRRRGVSALCVLGHRNGEGGVELSTERLGSFVGPGRFPFGPGRSRLTPASSR